MIEEREIIQVHRAIAEAMENVAMWSIPLGAVFDKRSNKVGKAELLKWSRSNLGLTAETVEAYLECYYSRNKTSAVTLKLTQAE